MPVETPQSTAPKPGPNPPHYRESSDVLQMETSIGPMWVGAEPRRQRHFQGVLNEVIEEDCYGLRDLARKKFNPKVIVDAGTHVGSFTRLSRELWPTAHSYCLEVMRNEPICGNFPSSIAKSLDLNIEGIPNVTVIRKGLIGHLDDPEADVVNHTDFNREFLGLEDRVRQGVHRWAQGISAKEFLETYGIDHIDLLKLDVEGCEVNILRELQSLGMLKHITHIRGEWHFEIARKEVQRLLKKTHKVKIQWGGPGEEWNTFTATRKRL